MVKHLLLEDVSDLITVFQKGGLFIPLLLLELFPLAYLLALLHDESGLMDVLLDTPGRGRNERVWLRVEASDARLVRLVD